MSPNVSPSARPPASGARFDLYKDFPPGWGHLKIPTVSRAAALAGLALYAPCRRRGIWIHRLAWTAVSALGSAALPGKEFSWHPPIPPDVWTVLVEDWTAQVGPWDAMAAYERLQPHRSGLTLLLIRQGTPIAFAKLRQGDGSELRQESDALQRMRAFQPRSFSVPSVIAMETHRGWHSLLLSPLEPKPHGFPSTSTVKLMVREIRAALADLPRPTGVPAHWQPMHGDFTPWNLRQLTDGSHVLIDWEEASWGPPGADEVLYRATTVALRGHPVEPVATTEAAEFWRERLRRKPVAGLRDEQLAISLFAALERIAPVGRSDSASGTSGPTRPQPDTAERARRERRRSNVLAPVVDPVHFLLETVRFRAQPRTPPRSVSGSALEKIDLVYLWSDPSDRKWSERRARVLEEHFDESYCSVNVNTLGSEASMEKLRYSLRSAQLHFRPLGRIFLIVDRQIPDWLDRDNPRVRVVEVEDVIGRPDQFPNYNTQAIESYMHRIPGLSEHFVYFNDDFFLRRDVTASDFFVDGDHPKVHLGRALAPRGIPTTSDEGDRAGHKNANQVLDECFGVRRRFTVMHRPYPHRKTLLAEAEAVFSEEYDITRAARFRSTNMVALHSFLVPYWASYHGETHFVAPRVFRKDMYHWSNDTRGNAGAIEAIRRSSQTALCIQEDRREALSAPSVQQFTGFMESLFPTPSEFELDAHSSGRD